MASDHVGLKGIAQSLRQHNRMNEDGGLGHRGLLEVFWAAIEHGIGNVKAEDFIGQFETRFQSVRMIVQVFSHSGKLGALAREYVCFHGIGVNAAQK